MVSPDRDSVAACVNELVRVEAGGWKARSGTAIARDPWMRRFVPELAGRMSKRGMLRFYFLRLGDQAIAAQMHIEHSGRLWQIKIGYDERWAKHSPGVLLTHEVLKDAWNRGLSGCEFLGLAEAWQRRWPVDTRSYTGFRFYPVSLRGGLAFTTDAIRHLRDRVIERVARGLSALPGFSPEFLEAFLSRAAQFGCI